MARTTPAPAYFTDAAKAANRAEDAALRAVADPRRVDAAQWRHPGLGDHD